MYQSETRTSISPHYSLGMNKSKRPLMLALSGLILLLQACATTPPAPSPSQQAQEEAKAAYLAHDYQRTLAIVEPIAIKEGEPWAQYTLGYMYHYGRGVTMDKKMAKQWIQRAAEQGYLPAQQAMQRLAASAPPRHNEEDVTAAAKPEAAQGAASAAENVPPPEMSKPGEPAPVLAMPDNSPPAAVPAMPSEPTTMTTTPAAAPAATPAVTPAMAAAATPDAAPAMAAATTPIVTPAATHASAKTKENGIKDRAWISAQDPKHFTVQLVAARNEAAIIRFIHKHGLEKDAAYYSITLKGKPWYTVIYGSYASLEEARQALRKLPASLGSSSPWIRNFSAVHKQLGPK